MAQYSVTANVQLKCEITVEAENTNEAQKEASQYLDVNTNYGGEFFKVCDVVDIEFEDVNES